MSFFLCVLNFVFSWIMGRVRELDVNFVILMNEWIEWNELGEFDMKLKLDKWI